MNQSSHTRSLETAASNSLEFSKMSNDSLIKFLSNLRTQEEEDAWWKSVLTEIALTDIDRALELASQAPSRVRGETLIAKVIAAERGGDALVDLAATGIGRIALAGGLVELSSDDVGSVLKALVGIRGKFGNEEMSALLISGEPWTADNAELLMAALDPTSWSLSSFRGPAGCLMNCDVGTDVVHEKLMALSQGNTALAADTIGKKLRSLAQRYAEQGGDDQKLNELRAMAVSREQSDRLLRQYAFGLMLSGGGMDSMEWALSLQTENDRRISTRAILNGIDGGSSSRRRTFISDLKKMSKSEPDSKIWPALNVWLDDLATRKPQQHKDFVEGLPTGVSNRLEQVRALEQ